MALKRRGARRLPQLGNALPPESNAPGIPQTADMQAQRPALYSGVWLELKELFRRVWTLENNGGGGAGTLTSLTATTPIVITPSPTTTVGVISHADTAVTPASYGDGTHVATFTVDQKGHITAAGTALITGGGSTSPLTTKGDIWGFSTLDARVPVGSNDKPLVADSTVGLGITYKTLPVAGGGTGDTTLTAHGVLVGEGTSAVAVTAVGTTGQFLGGNTGADPTWQTIPASGTLQSQEFAASGTWTRPSGVTAVWITGIGGGGGGSCTIAAATGGGGGGGGELVNNLLVPVSGDVTVTIGAKGTGGVTGQGSAQVGVAGGDTSFGTVYIMRGGKGAASTGVSGAGGGTNGSAAKTVASPGNSGTTGGAESAVYFGGGSGGAGGNTTAAAGGSGAGAGSYPTGAAGGSVAAVQAGGGGGANSPWGVGGAGGNGGGTGTSAAATSYGAGGGGAGGKATTTVAAGDGAPGYLLVVWVA